MTTMNVRDAITEVREKIHDRNNRTYDDAEVLRSFDNRVKKLFSALRTVGEAQELDYIDVTTATEITALENLLYEYVLPEWVADIQLIEARQGPGIPPIPIPKASLEDKDVTRAIFNITNQRAWHHSRRGGIQIHGSLSGFPTVRIWFVRAIPAMCYGTTTSGSLSTIVVAAATGAYKARDGLYTNSQIEITADTAQPTNVDALRRITDFSSGTFTFDDLPAAASSTTQWATVLPIPPEYNSLLIEEVVAELFFRTGSEEEVAAQRDQLREMRQEFEESIAVKGSGEPPRFVSSRRFL